MKDIQKIKHILELEESLGSDYYEDEEIINEGWFKGLIKGSEETNPAIIAAEKEAAHKALVDKYMTRKTKSNKIGELLASPFSGMGSAISDVVKPIVKAPFDIGGAALGGVGSVAKKTMVDPILALKNANAVRGNWNLPTSQFNPNNISTNIKALEKHVGEPLHQHPYDKNLLINNDGNITVRKSDTPGYNPINKEGFDKHVSEIHHKSKELPDGTIASNYREIYDPQQGLVEKHYEIPNSDPTKAIDKDSATKVIERQMLDDQGRKVTVKGITRKKKEDDGFIAEPYTTDWYKFDENGNATEMLGTSKHNDKNNPNSPELVSPQVILSGKNKKLKPEDIIKLERGTTADSLQSGYDKVKSGIKNAEIGNKTLSIPKTMIKNPKATIVGAAALGGSILAIESFLKSFGYTDNDPVMQEVKNISSTIGTKSVDAAKAVGNAAGEGFNAATEKARAALTMTDCNQKALTTLGLSDIKDLDKLTPEKKAIIEKRYNNSVTECEKGKSSAIKALEGIINASKSVFENTKKGFDKTKETIIGHPYAIAGAAVGAATVAGLIIARDVRNTRYKTDGCEVIEDPSDQMKCKKFLINQGIKNAKKQLNQCNLSNNPQMCIAEAKLAIKNNQLEMSKLNGNIPSDINISDNNQQNNPFENMF